MTKKEIKKEQRKKLDKNIEQIRPFLKKRYTEPALTAGKWSILKPKKEIPGKKGAYYTRD